MKSMDTFLKEFFADRLPCGFTYDGKPAEFGELKELGGNEEKRHYERVMQNERFKAVLNIDVLYGSAVEWWLDVSAPDEYDSDVLDDLHYCNVDIKVPRILAAGAEVTRYPSLHWAKGSRATETDYQPQHENLRPDKLVDPMTFHCDEGRTSSGVMPYFNLQTAEDEGYLFAIGWSGHWNLSVNVVEFRHDMMRVEFRAWMDRSRFRLYSGEKLSLPRMLLMPWSGVDIEGSYNLFRRLMSKQLPLVNGERVKAPVCLSNWGGRPAENHLNVIKIAKEKEIGAEVYWIDAGWFGSGSETDDNEFKDKWFENVGQWEPLKQLYPNGMEEVGQAVEDAGMRFLLWFELERAVSRHPIVREHREYFIGPKLPKDDLVYQFDKKGRVKNSVMLNFGSDDARRYITEIIANYIEKVKMSILRLDFNFTPQYYWRYADSEDRWGVTEIKYINGLYAFIDELRERYPHFMVENCASGGRRLDYMMTRRSIPLFFTDYLCVVDRKMAAMQMENYAVSRYIPIHGGAPCVEGVPDLYTYRSQMGTTIGVEGSVKEDVLEQNAEYYIKMVGQVKRARDILEKDLHLLTALTEDEKAWFAYEAYDDEAEKGLILAFRREECVSDHLDVRLHGVDPEGEYRLEDVDRGETVLSGREIAEKYTISIPEKRGSAIIFFERVR